MKKYLLLFGLLSFNANAQTPELMGEYGTWSSYYYNDGTQKVCYISATPVLDEGKYTSRNDINIVITHRPNDNSFDVFNINAGYTYKTGAPVEIKIGKTTINKIFTEKNQAWGINSGVDKQLLDAMKRGSKMIIHGTTNQNVATTDTYELSGFNEAYKAISTKCKK